MRDLINFTYQDQQVRTVEIDGEPWFVASDVARILGYEKATFLTRRLDEEDKGVRSLHTLGGDQQMTVISEPGLYDAVLGSKIPGARKFKRWVIVEVLPQIRKTGSYGAPAIDPANMSRLEILELAIASEKRALEYQPKAEAWETLASANGDYAVDEAAKILSRDQNIELGRNRLFSLMHDIGWTYRTGRRRSWHAYQSQVDNGRIRLRMAPAFRNAKTGELELPAPTIRVTAKGIEALRAHLTARKEMELSA